jgi:hypothetical protein
LLERVLAADCVLGRQHAFAQDEINHAIQTLTGFQVREHERALAAHFARIAFHHLQRGTHVRRQIYLVDDQQVRSHDARAAFARDLVAGGHIDHIERQIRQFRAEGRRQIVAAALDDDHVQRVEFLHQAVDRGQVHRCILANGGMRTASGLHAANSLGRQRLTANQKLSIFTGVDVVRDHRDVEPVAQALAQAIHQRGLARSDRAADANTKYFSMSGIVHRSIVTGELSNTNWL